MSDSLPLTFDATFTTYSRRTFTASPSEIDERVSAFAADVTSIDSVDIHTAGLNQVTVVLDYTP